MLDHDELDLDTTIYEPWDFHDRWDSPANFPLGGQSLLQQAREGHLRALFFIWKKWMKTVSRDTQRSWREHQSENPLGSLTIPPFCPKTQSRDGHSHLLDLFDLERIYFKSPQSPAPISSPDPPANTSNPPPQPNKRARCPTISYSPPQSDERPHPSGHTTLSPPTDRKSVV